MFRIEFYVDDKNLGECFKRLAGIARNVQHQYVPNVEGKANGQLKMTAADSMQAILKEMRHRKVTEVNASTARSVISDLGFNPNSYSYFLQRAVREGVMGKKKVGKGNQAMVYFVKAEK